MGTEHQEYKGHRIELRAPGGERLGAREAEGEAGPDLLIDDEPVRYGRLPDGQYFLEEYAYDWRDDLMALARRYVDYRITADERRREDEGSREDEESGGRGPEPGGRE